ncbi:hypothetical protein KFE18_05030 [Clostridiaceae bacterium Marseille-Q4143]|nr:hypothetical protein KFE18_05030 [Clostridiaceae bacterium Marseille-Q4143]
MDWKRNEARISSCKLHSFDYKGAIEREREIQEKFGVIVPMLPMAIRCRCKNCGGTMSLMYAMPYMEALKHVKEQEEKHE